MDREKICRLILKPALIIIALVPLIYFHQVKGVPLKAFILGSGSWGIGSIFKIIFHQLLVVPLQKKGEHKISAALLNGFLSGIFELSAAWLIVILMKEKFVFDFPAILSFGLAIGSLETLLAAFSKGEDLLQGTSLEVHAAKSAAFMQNTDGAVFYLFNVLFPVYERILATLIHISTRGLLFITLFSGNFLPLFLSLAVFIFADGLLTYYFYITDRLSTKKGILVFFLYLTLLTAASMRVFMLMIRPFLSMTL